MSDTLQDKFCERLFKLRVKRGFSQAELARRMNVTQPWIAMIESGSRTPHLKTIELLAEALEVSPSSLLK